MSLNFVNAVPNSTIWIAYLYYNDGCSGSPFQKEGWYAVTYGNSVSVWNGDVAWLNRYYYFHAESSTGSVWDGPINVEVTNNAFNQCQWDDNGCDRWAAFQEIDVGGNWDYTITLTDSTTPPPPPSGGGGDGGDIWGDGDGGDDGGDGGGDGWSGDGGGDGGDDG
jgi:uncharacterized membrane protein